MREDFDLMMESSDLRISGGLALARGGTLCL